MFQCYSCLIDPSYKMTSFDLSDLDEIRRDICEVSGIEYSERNFARIDALILKTWSLIDLVELARQNSSETEWLLRIFDETK